MTNLHLAIQIISSSLPSGVKHFEPWKHIVSTSDIFFLFLNAYNGVELWCYVLTAKFFLENVIVFLDCLIVCDGDCGFDKYCFIATHVGVMKILWSFKPNFFVYCYCFDFSHFACGLNSDIWYLSSININEMHLVLPLQKICVMGFFRQIFGTRRLLNCLSLHTSK